MGVNEGKNNVLNEASCLRVVSATNAAKIEIQNTAASGRLYEFRSNSDGSCSIFDRTTGVLRLSIAAAGGLENITSLNFTNDFIQRRSFSETRRETIINILCMECLPIRVALSGGARRVSYVLDWHIALDILLRDVYKPVRKYWASNYQNATLSRLFIKGGPTLLTV